MPVSAAEAWADLDFLRFRPDWMIMPLLQILLLVTIDSFIHSLLLPIHKVSALPHVDEFCLMLSVSNSEMRLGTTFTCFKL